MANPLVCQKYLHQLRLKYHLREGWGIIAVIWKDSRFSSFAILCRSSSTWAFSFMPVPAFVFESVGSTLHTSFYGSASISLAHSNLHHAHTCSALQYAQAALYVWRAFFWYPTVTNVIFAFRAFWTPCLYWRVTNPNVPCNAFSTGSCCWFRYFSR